MDYKLFRNMSVSTVQKALVALAVSMLAAVGVMLSAFCALELVTRSYYYSSYHHSAPAYFPSFSEADSATLAGVFVLGCLIAYSSSLILRRWLDTAFISMLYLNNGACIECNEKISRPWAGIQVVDCPSCHAKLVFNRKKQICLYLGVIILGLSLFFEKEVRWVFQLIYMVLTAAGLTMKEFERYHE